jgi:hypothetical protein
MSGQGHFPAALSQVKSARYPLNTRLRGPQSRSGGDGKEKNPCVCRKSSPDSLPCSLVTVLTELPQLFNVVHTNKKTFMRQTRLTAQRT